MNQCSITNKRKFIGGHISILRNIGKHRTVLRYDFLSGRLTYFARLVLWIRHRSKNILFHVINDEAEVIRTSYIAIQLCSDKANECNLYELILFWGKVRILNIYPKINK